MAADHSNDYDQEDRTQLDGSWVTASSKSSIKDEGTAPGDDSDGESDLQ